MTTWHNSLHKGSGPTYTGAPLANTNADTDGITNDQRRKKSYTVCPWAHCVQLYQTPSRAMLMALLKHYELVEGAQPCIH
jgi:hypothetical protein